MNIVITGASNGIGKELAILFAKNSVCKIIAVSRNQKKLLELGERVNGNTANGAELIPVAFDLREPDYSPIIDEVRNIGKIDILINNAAVLFKNELTDMTETIARDMFDVNFMAPVRLIKELYKLMGGETRSHIVNISSMAGYQGTVRFPGLSIYGASKAALASLSESLAVEFEQYNIAVNCLALGSVQTEMLHKAFPTLKAPLTSTEMAEFIMNFALTGHQYFNGKVLPVALSFR